MKITEVKVLPVEGNVRLKAYVTVKLDDCMIIRDLKVINGSTGLFVAMPAKKLADGTYIDLVHPLDKPTREMLETAVMKEYHRAAKSGTFIQAKT